MKTNSIRFSTPSYDFHLYPGDMYQGRSDKKTRVSLPNAWMGDIETPPYGVKGENADNDKAWRAYNREELRRMARHVDPAVNELIEFAKGDHGLDPTTLGNVIAVLRAKLTFSRKAGCSCGCSPAFIGAYRAYGAFTWGSESQYSSNQPIDTIFISPRQVGVERAPEGEPEGRTFTFADFDLQV